jgi:hypothetical protein
MVLGLGPFLTGRALDINDFTALFSLFGIIPRLFILVILNSLFAGAIPPPSDSALRRRSHLRQLPIILGIKVLPKFDLISFNLYCRWCQRFNPAGGIAAHGALRVTANARCSLRRWPVRHSLRILLLDGRALATTRPRGRPVVATMKLEHSLLVRSFQCPFGQSLKMPPKASGNRS